ncbi:MAG: MFS transporter [Hyphomicrobiales bacterium]|nr:MFS transporter [Hyphomicrobiales bacterium]MBV8440208.1 MFS transporter [Hyphomicrobiales bacterium]
MISIPANKGAPSARGIFSPLRHAVFRRIWTASLLSNLGILVLGVGAAWTMTQISSSTGMVALVQTSLMLPVALVSTPAGAIADMFDRRIVGIVALSIALTGSISLSALAWLGVVTPVLLLVFCFIIGSGMALFGPAWQASVSEQVPAAALPSAVALNGISYNIARSFGPAIGGVIVASAGAVAAFATNALLYLPLLIVLFLWRRLKEPSRLPPERLARAVISGVRYIVHSPPIRIVLGRTLVTGIAGGSVAALMPLVARDLLHGGAQTYGVMLGAFGMGAVIGALNISAIRGRLGDEASIRLCMIVMGFFVAVVAISRSPVASGIALVFAGAAWTASVTVFNVGVQLAAPRWVAGRALAAYQAAISGGIALGSWVWGSTASVIGVEGTLLISGAALLVSPLLGLWMRMPTVSGPNELSLDVLADPEVRLSLTPRSGPIVMEIEYRVDPAKARLFYAVMQHVQLSRQRNGAYGWSIARDIADPELWTERYHCPTWQDYLRQRSRSTASERALHLRANEFHIGPEPIRIRRMLERPVGSVRWKEDTPDRSTADAAAMTSPGTGP